MKVFRRMKLVVFILAIVSTCSTILITSNNTIATTLEKAQELNTELDYQKLKEMGIKLDTPKSIPLISEEEAINNAQTAFGDMNIKTNSIKVEYHLITNPGFQAFSEDALNKNSKLKNDKYMNELPAYIVSFRNVKLNRYGDSFKKRDISNTEFNVVVDANSGEALMAFSNR